MKIGSKRKTIAQSSNARIGMSRGASTIQWENVDSENIVNSSTEKIPKMSSDRNL